MGTHDGRYRPDDWLTEECEEDRAADRELYLALAAFVIVLAVVVWRCWGG